MRPPYQDWKAQQTYLIYKNKFREAAKMGRQIDILQIKNKQDKSPEKHLNKIGKQSTTELKTMVMRMLKKCR